MLRSYDNRFRQTNRSSAIYKSSDCKDILGGDAIAVVNFPTDFLSSPFGGGLEDDFFWSQPTSLASRDLLIIATPYRVGDHVAKSVKAFLPLIEQLLLLHKKGFVHGDIRAFNVVFNDDDQDDNKKSCLIDFDFGGPIGETTCYPEGYRQTLDDGSRIGAAREKIEMWHDWFALWKLIFHVHDIAVPDDASAELDKKFLRISKFRVADLNTHQKVEAAIKELKSLLGEVIEQEWVVTPSDVFMMALKDNATSQVKDTCKGATGSPPQKMPQKQHQS